MNNAENGGVVMAKSHVSVENMSDGDRYNDPLLEQRSPASHSRKNEKVSVTNKILYETGIDDDAFTWAGDWVIIGIYALWGVVVAVSTGISIVIIISNYDDISNESVPRAVIFTVLLVFMIIACCMCCFPVLRVTSKEKGPTRNMTECMREKNIGCVIQMCSLCTSCVLCVLLLVYLVGVALYLAFVDGKTICVVNDPSSDQVFCVPMDPHAARIMYVCLAVVWLLSAIACVVRVNSMRGVDNDDHRR
jgi:hypothetical protein